MMTVFRRLAAVAALAALAVLSSAGAASAATHLNGNCKPDTCIAF